ncbi:MAG: glycosyltransferase family 4 protein [Gammaproteobacteria bacterium]|nr:glycosyltransferase family 4 protein [Gammaproteobacteria bacterium]MCW5583447.1 glycosyltransferase family 4 protein [Gammaproteobacteria bacterium]
MRILLITDNHTLTGGAENYFFDLKRRLKNVPDVEVYSIGFAACSEKGDDFYVLKGLKSKIAKLFWQFLFHPGVYFTLRQQLKKICPDVIHIHNVKQYTASVLAAIKPYPVVQTIHDYSVICPSAYNVHKNHQPCPTGMKMKCFWQHHVKYSLFTYLAMVCSFFTLRARLKKTVKKFIAPSPLLVEYLKQNHFNDATYISPFKQEKTHYSFEQMQPCHFLFAGNLGMHKGIDILLDEFSLAQQKNPHITLTIAGTGSEEQHLHDYVKKLNLEKQISFIGWQTSLEKEYVACAVVVFPSLCFEAFGLVMTEAMSYARPVIAANRSTAPWLIDDQQTGLLFDPLIKGDLAEKMLILAGNIERIKTLGKNGFHKLESFIDNEVVLQQLITLYRDLKVLSQN